MHMLDVVCIHANVTLVVVRAAQCHRGTYVMARKDYIVKAG